MTYALNYTASISIVTCCVCGAPIALANRGDLLASRAAFHCPNGHSQSFTGNEISKLQAELAREKQRREMAERDAAMERDCAADARKTSQRLEKKLKRVSNGVCPCCSRSFANLRRHMATKHPDQKS